ncbi:VanZ family protein [Paeniglutamicibacter gangotriensis]|uniref:VanZ family protein n=1 Tax=Paeniglutamicibacter gangotriensis TaxID=254787 RepID=A0A5B0EJ96_9MICC|nr:VanZ family protein [Paeniglutamicibacter gangotriensis]
MGPASNIRHEYSSLMTKPHVRVAVGVAALYLAALMAIAFWPTPVDRPMSGNLTTVITWLQTHGMPGFIGYNTIEFAANIVLFMPLGYLAGVWSRTWWLPVAVGLGASVLIELGQAIFLPERFSSVFDVVANTLGAGAGAGLFLLLGKWDQHRDAPPGAPSSGTAPAEYVRSNPPPLP